MRLTSRRSIVPGIGFAVPGLNPLAKIS